MTFKDIKKMIKQIDDMIEVMDDGENRYNNLIKKPELISLELRETTIFGDIDD